MAITIFTGDLIIDLGWRLRRIEGVYPTPPEIILLPGDMPCDGEANESVKRYVTLTRLLEAEVENMRERLDALRAEEVDGEYFEKERKSAEYTGFLLQMARAAASYALRSQFEVDGILLVDHNWRVWRRQDSPGAPEFFTHNGSGAEASVRPN